MLGSMEVAQFVSIQWLEDFGFVYSLESMNEAATNTWLLCWTGFLHEHGFSFHLSFISFILQREMTGLYDYV